MHGMNDSAVATTRVFVISRGARTSNSTPQICKQNKTVAEHSAAVKCKHHALADRGKNDAVRNMLGCFFVIYLADLLGWRACTDVPKTWEDMV